MLSTRVLRDRFREAVEGGRRTGGLQLLIALLPLVPLLIVADQLHHWGLLGLDSVRWRVARDRSFIEILGYTQVAVAVVLLLGHGLLRHRGRVYTGWAVVLVVVVVDDSLALHENGGHWLKQRLPLPQVLGLQEQEIGELLVFALLGTLVLGVLAATHRDASRQVRQDSAVLLVVLVFLASFAVGVDAVHSALKSFTDSNRVNVLATWLEAAGELSAMSALLAYAVHVVRRPAPPARAAAAPYAAEPSDDAPEARPGVDDRPRASS